MSEGGDGCNNDGCCSSSSGTGIGSGSGGGNGRALGQCRLLVRGKKQRLDQSSMFEHCGSAEEEEGGKQQGGHCCFRVVCSQCHLALIAAGVGVV